MTRLRPTPRGSTLILAMVLLTVLTVLGIAAVSLGYGERTGAAVKTHRDRIASCASAAQAVIWSELSIFGAGYLKSSEISQGLVLPGGMKLRIGHYGDTTAVVNIVGAEEVPCADLKPEEQYIDITNKDSRFNASGGCHRVYLRCYDDSGQEPRELEIELGLNSLF